MKILQNSFTWVSRIYFNLVYETIRIAAVTLLGYLVLEISQHACEYVVYGTEMSLSMLIKACCKFLLLNVDGNEHTQGLLAKIVLGLLR